MTTPSPTEQYICPRCLMVMQPITPAPTPPAGGTPLDQVIEATLKHVATDPTTTHDFVPAADPAGGTVPLSESAKAHWKASAKREEESDCTLASGSLRGFAAPAAEPAVEIDNVLISARRAQAEIDSYNMRDSGDRVATIAKEFAWVAPLVAENAALKAQVEIVQDRELKTANERDALKAQVERLEKVFAEDSWTAEMQAALGAIPNEFLGNDFWVNGVRRMASTITDLRAELADEKKSHDEIVRNQTSEIHRLLLRPDNLVFEQMRVRSETLKGELATATAELAQERARLDWLEKRIGGGMPYGFSAENSEGEKTGETIWEFENMLECWTSLRQAIDAARKQEGKL